MSNVAEERLAALVDGTPAVSHDEVCLVETLRTVRRRPVAPPALREHVHGLERDRARSAVSWRRVLLVAAPAWVFFPVGPGVAAGLVSSRSAREQVVDGAAPQRAP